MPPCADECCVTPVSETLPMKKGSRNRSARSFSIWSKARRFGCIGHGERQRGRSAALQAAVGQIIGEMFVEIMNPIYAEHPDLKPPQLR